MAATRQCACDGTQQFPADQFRFEPDYGWLHDVDPLHTIDGDTVWLGASMGGGFDQAIPQSMSHPPDVVY